MTVFQATICDAFNKNETCTVQELQNMTGIEEEKDFKRHLLSLCHPKFKVLNKQKKNPKFDDPNEKISINLKFSNAKIRVDVKPAQSKVENQET